MTQRKKLVELIAEGRMCPVDGNPFEEEKCLQCKYAEDKDCDLTRLADYLLENGVIVPPCKIGDKIWLVLTEKRNNDWCIFEDIVESFVHCDSYEFVFDMKIFGYIHIDRKTNDIDDGLYDGCAYFTKEEAEKALAEKESKHGCESM